MIYIANYIAASSADEMDIYCSYATQGTFPKGECIALKEEHLKQIDVYCMESSGDNDTEYAHCSIKIHTRWGTDVVLIDRNLAQSITTSRFLHLSANIE